MSVLAFGGCCLCLPLLFCAFFLCCLGLLRIGSFSSWQRPLPRPARPLGWSLGAFWSSQFSAGPSLRVSGCILRRPGCHACGGSCLHFSSSTKALALCGALPSTPCCGCCSGAFLSCTEVFALVIRNPPLDTVRAACAHLLGPCCFLPSCPLLPLACLLCVVAGCVLFVWFLLLVLILVCLR